MVDVMPMYATGKAAKSQDEMGDVERKHRVKWMDELWAYYDGDSKDMLKVDAGGRNDNIKNNLLQRAVDRAGEFIGVPTDFEIAEMGKAEEAQVVLDDLYKRHRHYVSEILQSGLLAGHVFLKLIWDSETESPGFVPIDPRFVTVYTNVMNPRQVVFYRLQWMMGDTGYRQDIVPVKYLQGAEAPLSEIPSEATWAIVDYRQGREGWERVALDWWLMPDAPIVEWRNKKRAFQYYGASDFAYAPKANDAVNFLESNTGRIIKFHAHPRTIGAGVDVNEIQATSIDGFFSVPQEAQIYNLEMQSDLSSSMAFLNQKKADFFDACRVVDPSSIKDKVGALTNFGLRVIYSNMLEMTDEKRGEYGAGLAEAFRRMLVMLGYEIEVGAVVAHWDDPLPVNRLEILQGAAIEKQLGITSDKSISELLDRDYDNEQAQKAEEMRGAGMALADVLARAGETGGM